METLQVVAKDRDGVWRVKTLTVEEVSIGVMSGTVSKESLPLNGDFPTLVSIAKYLNQK